ncbi:hypothetical protein B566_EDAN007753 [Ephemera danica]|nr:hypothetical protein B566_EDAN007753 [Ephemera danica]
MTQIQYNNLIILTFFSRIQCYYCRQTMQMIGASLSILLLLFTFFVTHGKSSECYTCISTQESACIRPQKNNNASVLTRSSCGMAPSVSKLLRNVVPDVDDVFTVWPPTGNADCLRLNITPYGELRTVPHVPETYVTLPHLCGL